MKKWKSYQNVLFSFDSVNIAIKVCLEILMFTDSNFLLQNLYSPTNILYLIIHFKYN